MDRQRLPLPPRSRFNLDPRLQHRLWLPSLSPHVPQFDHVLNHENRMNQNRKFKLNIDYLFE